VAVDAKICGLTRPADAALAAAAGATYLGVVFAGGPRAVAPDTAAAIVAAAAGVPVFGVFGSQTVDDILRICATAGLAGAQLHGEYPRAAAAALRAAGLEVWRVARVAAAADLDRLSDLALDADAVLVEPRVEHRAGGAGVPLDLTLATEARQRLHGRRMVLAGGLGPDTVAEAIALVGPEVVDVSSGVEHRLGLKDPDKIARFLEAVFGHSSPR
jgi:phosphoribosylanthranilate isomerase